MGSVISIAHYKNNFVQRIRQLSVFSASFIWVRQGCKKIYYQPESGYVNKNNLLLLSANSTLSFENKPNEDMFFSTQINFLEKPSGRLLNYSQRNHSKQDPYLNILPLSHLLKQMIEFLVTLDLSTFSVGVQRQLVLTVFQQLAEEEVLHCLFPEKTESFYHKVILYFNADLMKKHTIEEVSAYFFMSRATLIRRLKKEGFSFYQLLLSARMNFALSLMQSGIKNQEELALLCGYQSKQYFTKKFKDEFGLSIASYLQTL